MLYAIYIYDIYVHFIYPVKLDQISEISSYNASLCFYIYTYVCVCLYIYLYSVCVCIYIPIEIVNEIYSYIS